MMLLGVGQSSHRPIRTGQVVVRFADARTCREREDGEDGLLFGCAESQFEPVGPGLERPKNADLQHQSQTLATRNRPVIAAL
jgi:hypothetical protein